MHDFIRTAHAAFQKWMVERQMKSDFSAHTSAERLIHLGQFHSALISTLEQSHLAKLPDGLTLTEFANELNKAWWESIKPLQYSGDEFHANRVFREAIKPHFEARLF